MKLSFEEVEALKSCSRVFIKVLDKSAFISAKFLDYVNAEGPFIFINITPSSNKKMNYISLDYPDGSGLLLPVYQYDKTYTFYSAEWDEENKRYGYGKTQSDNFSDLCSKIKEKLKKNVNE